MTLLAAMACLPRLGIFKGLRVLVSGDKRRFQADGFGTSRLPNFWKNGSNCLWVVETRADEIRQAWLVGMEEVAWHHPPGHLAQTFVFRPLM